MRHKFNILAVSIIGLFLLATKCNLSKDLDDGELTDVKPLSEFNESKFAYALEQKITPNKNTIYASSLLLAWNEIRKELKHPIIIDNKYKDLQVLNASKSFIKTLLPTEYETEISNDNDVIVAKASFQKALPFAFPQYPYKKGINFQKSKVKAFYANAVTNVLFYQNDNFFAIELILKDPDHKLILFKSPRTNYTSLTEILNTLNYCVNLGNLERNNGYNSWKYSINPEDEVIIPKFNFNIEHDYAIMLGNKFACNKQELVIEKIWQRTGFFLDERGAIIESEAEIEVPTVESIPEKQKPKKLILDKPFLLIAQRRDSKKPYFAVWNQTAELMEKQIK